MDERPSRRNEHAFTNFSSVMCGTGSGIQIDELSGNQRSEISCIYVIRQDTNNIQFYLINGSIPILTVIVLSRL